MSGKCRIVLGLLVSLMFVAIPSAQAHEELVGATPAAGSSLSSLPNKVRLVFSDKLQSFDGKAVNVIVVEDPNGEQIDVGDSVVSGATLSVNIRDQGGFGEFHVSYRVVSGDGHPVSGDYYFTVSETEIPLAAGSSSTLEAMSATSAEVPTKTAGVSSQDSFWTRHQGGVLLGFFAFVALLIWWLIDKRRREWETVERIE